MSEAAEKPEKTPEPDSSAKTAQSPGPAKPVSRRRKWRRRLTVLLVVVIAIVVLLRASVSFLLPPVLRKVAGHYGLTASYDRLDLYASSGDVGLWGLRFVPIEGGPPVIQTEYCRGSISVLALFTGRLIVNRAEAEEAALRLERLPDGSIPLLQKILGSQSTRTSSSTAIIPHSLNAPLKIDVLRLQNANVQIRDLAMHPATDVSLMVDLLLTDVGSLDKATRLQMQIHSPEMLTALYVDATGASRNNQLDADLSLKMYGLNLHPAQAYLAPLQIRTTSADISAEGKGHLYLQLKPAAAANAAPADVSAKLSLSDLRLTSDMRPAGSIKSITIDAPSLAPGAIHIAAIDISGVRANASRLKGGSLSFAGVELGSSATSAQTQPTSRPVAPMTPSVASSASPIVELKKLRVEDVELAFDDAATTDPTHLSLHVPSLEIDNVSTDPAQAKQPATIKLQASAPGLINDIRIDGRATPADKLKTLNLTVAATGIAPKAAAEYLAALGLKSDLTSGQFNCMLTSELQSKPDGSIAGGMKLTNVRFSDQNRELVNLANVEVRDASVSGDLSHIKLGQVSVEGPVVPIQRDAKGIFSIGGFERTTGKPVALDTAHTTVDSAATQPSAPLRLPAIEIEKLSWHGATFALQDLETKDPLNLGVRNIDLDAQNLVLDPAAHQATPGSLHFVMHSPGVIDRMDIQGTIAPTADALSFKLAGDCSGVTGEGLKPILSALGVEPILHDGRLKFVASGSARQEKGKVAADLALTDVSFADGDSQWLGVGGLQVHGASFDGKILDVQSIQIDKPTAMVARDADGLISLAGIKQLALRPTATTPTPVTTQPSPTQIDVTLPVIARIKSFKLNDASLRISDEAVLPHTDLSATVNVIADGIDAGEDAPPARFEATVSSPGIIDSLKAEGTLKASPKSQAIELSVTGSNVQGQAIEAYLPRNAKVRFNRGQFAARVSAKIDRNPQGGSSGSLSITDASLSDGLSPTPVGAIKSMHIGVDRIDIPGKRIALDDVTIDGAELAGIQDKEGVSLLGLTFASQPLRPAPTTRPSFEPIATSRPTDVAEILREEREKPPLVTLKKLAINADRISLKSPMVAQDLAITHLSLANAAPIELLGDDPTRRPPVEFKFNAGVEKLIDSLSLDAKLAPFAAQPHAKIDLNVGGIHGDQLTTFLPGLKEQLDGKDLSNGHLTATADAQFAFTRRGPMGIDLTRDVTAEFDLKNAVLSENGVEQPLGGVGEIHGERIRVSPANGSVVVKSIDITKPMAHVVRDSEGIHFLGLTLKNPPPATQPAAQPAAEHVPALATAAKAPAAGPTAGGSEMRIDRLTVSDADFSFEDRIGKPATILPINALDVEVKGLDSDALTQPRPIRFSAIVGAGQVALPPLQAKNGQTTEMRPIFAEASANGDLVLVPKPSGYIKLSLSGLEMGAIRGLAEEQNIKLTSGTFDFRADVRMQGTDNFRARMYPTFNNLRVTEAPKGPIEKILKLPVPLDVALAAVEDTDGSITFPLTVPYQAGKLDVGTIAGSAVGSVSEVFAQSIAAAPLKAAKMIGNIAGLDTSSSRLKPIPPVLLNFAPGESELTLEQRVTLNQLLDRLRRDPTLEVTIQQTLASDDIDRARLRSNPERGDSLAIAQWLRQRKFDLQSRQQSLSSQLRAAIAAQSRSQSDDLLEALRATCIELKETEEGLDQVLALVGPGADRQSERRTKAAALVLANLRLRSVQEYILSSNVKSISQRLRKSNATYNPNDKLSAGEVTLVLIHRAKS